MKEKTTPSAKGLIVAIDGPSGAGKSTITIGLAKLLNYIYIDTGAMYRALALAVSRAGISLQDEEKVVQLCRNSSVGFRLQDGIFRVILNGEDVADLIRTPEISLLTSRIARIEPVRKLLLSVQREMGRAGGVIMEGRDIGSVVFPDADVKFFLSASPEERGKRRYQELTAKGEKVELAQTIAEVKARDEQDTFRDHSPLLKADDAISIDSTDLTIDQVVGKMAEIIRHKVEDVNGRK